MATSVPRPWRVVFRGQFTADIATRLAAAGIAPCGSAFVAGGLANRPLRVLALDAEDAFVRVSEALGGTRIPVFETPVRLDE